MRSLPFPDYLRNYSRILGEGAVIERLRRDPAAALDPHVVNSAFVYNPVKRRLLENIYRQYLQIGFDHDLPLVMSATTWRATVENIAASGHGGLDVNGDNVRLLQGLRDEFGSYAAKVVIGGLIGCRGRSHGVSLLHVSAADPTESGRSRCVRRRAATGRRTPNGLSPSAGRVVGHGTVTLPLEQVLAATAAHPLKTPAGRRGCSCAALDTRRSGPPRRARDS